MSNHQKKADNHQRKADISAEFVGPLLKRLKQAKERVPENSEMEKFINEISPEVVKTKDFLNCREKLDKKLVGYLGKIERQIDPWIDQKPREKASDLPKKDTIIEAGESSNRICQMDEVASKDQEFVDLLKSFDMCGRLCVQSLSLFPENTKLKKRLVIYWWDTIFFSEQFRLIYSVEGVAEYLFSRLIDKMVLKPVHREQKTEIDCFTIEPTFYKWLISNSERLYGDISSEKKEEGTLRLLYRRSRDLLMLLNLDQRYLNSKELMDISSTHENLGVMVVQLGSWRCTDTEVHNRFEETGSEETKSKDHIEVDQTDFLKKLGENVSYLSLQGISGITELPESIGKLYSLRILNLRACHNLEKLPQKPKQRSLLQKIISAFSEESIWFNKLEVLDISECYLLDYMPKWVCELSNLQVLKGFVVGSLGNKKQSCRLGDLSKLKNLEKLSIRFTNDILSPEVFQGFNYLNNLSILTITWGENKNKEIPTYSLPWNLEKLDMRCYPEANASKWNNLAELRWLKRLYIRGGNLTEIPCHNNWKVEVLRLRFLKKMVNPTNWEELRSSFQNLKYVEYVGCSKPIDFPSNGVITWRNEEQDKASTWGQEEFARWY